MSLQILPVVSRKDLDTFIRLPDGLPERRPNYVPPIWSEEEAYHDPVRNPDIRGNDVVRYLAWRNGRAVGRIMGIIHHGYNRLVGHSYGRFHQLDCINDAEVVAAMLDHIGNWAAERGMITMMGPFGFSDKDPQGLQTEGFEHVPVLATPTNPAYMPALVEACGYSKHADAMAYRLDMPDALPAAYHRAAARSLAAGYHLVDLPSKRALKPWVVPLLRLVNTAYTGLLGFMPMDEQAMHALADKYMLLLDPRFVKILADANDGPVAFVVAMPDMSEGLQRAAGRLFPFGFIQILLAMRRSRQLDLFLGAVRPDLQGKGLAAALGLALMQEAKGRGFTHLDSHLVLETNKHMRSQLERLGAVPWKRYRVYAKALV
jgi:GNAT superfamily N-acetyltransferase